MSRNAAVLLFALAVLASIAPSAARAQDIAPMTTAPTDQSLPLCDNNAQDPGNPSSVNGIFGLWQGTWFSSTGPDFGPLDARLLVAPKVCVTASGLAWE